MPSQTYAQKLVGRCVDACFCKTCDINKGIYILLADNRKYICPHCNQPITERVTITIDQVIHSEK